MWFSMEVNVCRVCADMCWVQSISDWLSQFGRAGFGGIRDPWQHDRPLLSTAMTWKFICEWFIRIACMNKIHEILIMADECNNKYVFLVFCFFRFYLSKIEMRQRIAFCICSGWWCRVPKQIQTRWLYAQRSLIDKWQFICFKKRSDIE